MVVLERKMRTYHLVEKSTLNPHATRQSMLPEECVRLLRSALLRRSPDRKAERDLVHEVREVVHQVQSAVIDTSHLIAKEVPERVDGPTYCHDEAHGLEGSLHMLVHLVATCGNLAGLACENLEQDEEPTGHTHGKTQPSIHEMCLTAIARRQHDDGATQ